MKMTRINHLQTIQEDDETENSTKEEYEVKHVIDYDKSSEYTKKALSFMYSSKCYENNMDDFLSQMEGHWEAHKNDIIDRTRQYLSEITQITRGILKEVVQSNEWKEVRYLAEDENKCAKLFYNLVNNCKRLKIE